MKLSFRAALGLVLIFSWSFVDLGVAPQVALGQGPGASNNEGQQGGGRGGRRGRGRRGGEGQAAQQVEGGNTAQSAGGGPGGGRRGFGRRGRGDQANTEGDAAAGRSNLQIATAPNPEDLARQMFTQNDRNGDGMLQADESRFLRGQTDAFDTDKNGVITQNELAAGYAGGMGGPGRGRGRGSDNGGDENNSEQRGRGRGENRSNDNNNNDRNNDNDRDNNNNNNRNRNRGSEERPVETAKTLMSLMTEQMSYRLRSGKESLPSANLPSWFTSRDKDGDGQVAMSEYAARLTDRLAQEFIRRDTNGDGLITADEALASR